jgi:hypothetical protein
MKATPFALACALFGVTALASAALGQTSGQSSGASPATSSPEAARPGTQIQRDRPSDQGRPNLADDNEDMRGGGRWGSRMEGRHDGERGAGMPMGSAMMQMMREHHATGARFYLRRGDSALSIRCPAGEPLNNCIDAAGRLIDKLQAIPQK